VYRLKKRNETRSLSLSLSLSHCENCVCVSPFVVLKKVGGYKSSSWAIHPSQRRVCVVVEVVIAPATGLYYKPHDVIFQWRERETRFSLIFPSSRRRTDGLCVMNAAANYAQARWRARAPISLRLKVLIRAHWVRRGGIDF
jgi:hypothetical protein